MYLVTDKQILNPSLSQNIKAVVLSIEKLVISLYAKGMSASDIEEEMKGIYGATLSSSAISIITNKVTQAA